MHVSTENEEKSREKKVESLKMFSKFPGMKITIAAIAPHLLYLHIIDKYVYIYIDIYIYVYMYARIYL